MATKVQKIIDMAKNNLIFLMILGILDKKNDVPLYHKEARPEKTFSITPHLL